MPDRWRLAARLALMVAIAATGLGLGTFLLAGRSTAGLVTITVNSQANTDDGACQPLAAGDCTLHEAIDHANAGGVDVIDFDPVVFPPGNLNIIDVSSGIGELPAVTVSGLQIAASGAEAVVDGGGAGSVGLRIAAGENGFDFEISAAGGYLELFRFSDAGIDVCGALDSTCDDFTFRNVIIDGVVINETVSGPGLRVLQPDVTGVNATLTVQDSRFENSGDAGMRVCCGYYSAAAISGNTIFDNDGGGIVIEDSTAAMLIAENSIAFNGGPGVRIEGDDSDRNTITQNMIWDNNGLGIDLVDSSGQGIGCDDGIDGPNDCLPAPQFTDVFVGEVKGITCPGCTVEVFLADNDPPDQFGHGEGRSLLTTTAADSFGVFNAVIPCDSAPPGEDEIVTATATDSDGSTSEFSGNVPFIDYPCSPTSTPTQSGPTATPTATPTGPTSTPTKQPAPGDTDGDGCFDVRENGADEMLGGRRDYTDPWDYYDVDGDAYVSFLDILSVISRYTASPQLPYIAAADRGPRDGPDPWNMTAPDGTIDLPNDILGVIFQYQHDCS